jgi:Fe-S-cluster containining protein
MQLPVVDPSARFSCGSCTACCNQPWRTVIEEEKAVALNRHDFSAYPSLQGRKFYQRAADGRPGYFDLAKGEGNMCLFLDTDGLCIIHKELGAAAKPDMCLQFPYLPSRTWTEHRVSVNFGCPSVQSQRGTALTQQLDDIRQATRLSDRPFRGSGVRVPLDTTTTVSHDEFEAIIEQAMMIFDDARPADVWSRFAELTGLLIGVRDYERSSAEGGGPGLMAFLDDRMRGSIAPSTKGAVGFEDATAAPMPVRMLFAATLFPDTLPATSSGRVGLFRRLTLLPKLMSLARLSGGYASRIMGRNISIDAVVARSVDGSMDDAATTLLLRYFRSRFWQRIIVGTRLPIIAGIHQHILDLNAIVFIARAEAQARGDHRLSEAHVRKALTGVEFHLANQTRMYEQTLKGWLRTQLCDASLALQSLRLMAPMQEPAAVK